MKLLEYLQRKYGKEKPSVMTLSEAEAFGVPYPLQRGWLEIYGHIELSQNVIDGLVAKLKRKAANKPKKNGTGFYYERGVAILSGQAGGSRFSDAKVDSAVTQFNRESHVALAPIITSPQVYHEIMKQHRLTPIRTKNSDGLSIVEYGAPGSLEPLLKIQEKWDAQNDPEKKAFQVEYWIYIPVRKK